MAVRVPGIRLWMNMILLLVTVVEFSDSQTTQNSAFPQVVPSRQQFFLLESITISCEGLKGLTGWRVMKRINGDIRTCASSWETSTGPCKISNAYRSTDSGEYWCEMGGKEKSNSVNITVTDGPVILESPVYPVKEGNNVTVHCRKKNTNSSVAAEFFKNGISVGRSSVGTMITPTVSKSFEGLYKCSISEAGESPESWLAVGTINDPSPGSRVHLYVLLCIGFIVLLVVVLLLLVGLRQHQKHQQPVRGHTEETSLTPNSQISTASFQAPSSAQTVSAEASIAESTDTTYALITNPGKKKELSRSGTVPARTKPKSSGEDMNTVYCTVQNHE